MGRSILFSNALSSSVHSTTAYGDEHSAPWTLLLFAYVWIHISCDSVCVSSHGNTAVVVNFESAFHVGFLRETCVYERFAATYAEHSGPTCSAAVGSEYRYGVSGEIDNLSPVSFSLPWRRSSSCRTYYLFRSPLGFR
jgi:hypothetical protein